MPVQNVTNSIIQAYLAGAGIREKREAEKTRKLENEDAIKREQKRFEDITKAAEKQQDTENKRQEAIAAYSRAQIDQQLAKSRAEQYGTFGEVPGYKPAKDEAGNTIVSKSISTTPGYATTASELAPTPEQVQVDPTAKPFYGIEPGNLAEQGRRETQYADEAKLAQLQQIEEMKSNEAIRINQDQAVAKLREQDVLHGYRLSEDAANNRAALARTIAGRAATAAKEDYLTENQLIEYGDFDTRGNRVPLPAGTTFSDIKGKRPVKLNPTQENKIAFYNDIEDRLTEIDKLLDKEQGGKGYDLYYKGGSQAGVFLAGAQALKQPRGEDISEVEAKIGDARSTLTVERYGASVTSGEKDEMNKFVPTTSHVEDPATMRAKVKQGIKTAQDRRKALLGVKGIESGGDNRVRIKVDAQGNEIQ